MNYPAYPTYRESGVAWLGAVPEHWEVKRLKYMVSINDEVLAETTDPEYEFSYVDIGSVSADEGIIKQELMSFETAPSRARRIVKTGDTIVSTVRTYLRAIAPIHEINERLIVSTGFAVLRPRRIKSGYLAYALKEKSFIENVVSRSVGVSYPAVNANEIGDVIVNLPPLSEQTNIADFLDRETGRIDTLIAKKRRLIGLLKEKRSALISRTVTRGLPADAAREFGLEPHTRFKDSGIEWLGEVPEGWVLKAIKWETQVQRGASPRPIDDPVYFDDYGEYSWVRISDVTSAGMYLEQTEQRLSELGSSLSVKLQPGSLFLSIAGTVGKPCISRIKCCIHDGFVYFPKWKDESRYLFYIFASGEPYKGLGKMGTQLNLNTDTVGGIVIGIPTIEEQTAIANYLDRETAKIDKLIDKVEEAIERLQEYRTALITAAVTGKIDVRYAAERAGQYGLAAEEAETYG